MNDDVHSGADGARGRLCHCLPLGQRHGKSREHDKTAQHDG
jgi:hypothetical protein